MKSAYEHEPFTEGEVWIYAYLPHVGRCIGRSVDSEVAVRESSSNRLVKIQPEQREEGWVSARLKLRVWGTGHENTWSINANGGGETHMFDTLFQAKGLSWTEELSFVILQGPFS